MILRLQLGVHEHEAAIAADHWQVELVRRLRVTESGSDILSDDTLAVVA